MEEYASKTIAILGGVQVIVTSVILAVWTVLLYKLQARWNSRTNKELEEIKGGIQKYNSTLVSVLNNQSSVYLVAHERRLIAIESLWGAYLNLRSLFPTGVDLMYAILDEKEIKNILIEAPSAKIIRSSIRELDAEKYILKVRESTNHLDAQRIYIEPEVWQLFYACRALSGRVVYNIGKQRDQGQITMWHNDSGVNQIMGLFMTEDEILTSKSMGIGSLNFAFGVVEAKLLNAISQMIVGDHHYKLTTESILSLERLKFEEELDRPIGAEQLQ